MYDIALNYLEQNKLLHMDMIVPIKRNTAQIILASAEGVCLKDIQSGAYFHSAANHKTGKTMLENLPQNGLFSFHQSFMLEDFVSKVHHKTMMKNHQAVYFSKKPFEICSNLSIKPMQMKDFDTLMANYDFDLGREYLIGRINAGEVFGGYINGDLIGFAGIHEEGSVGLLKVLEQFRSKGYAIALASYVANHQLSQGITPFIQISIENKPSQALAKKLGFTISKEHIYWLF